MNVFVTCSWGASAWANLTRERSEFWSTANQMPIPKTAAPAHCVPKWRKTLTLIPHENSHFMFAATSLMIFQRRNQFPPVMPRWRHVNIMQIISTSRPQTSWMLSDKWSNRFSHQIHQFVIKLTSSDRGHVLQKRQISRGYNSGKKLPFIRLNYRSARGTFPY